LAVRAVAGDGVLDVHHAEFLKTASLAHGVAASDAASAADFALENMPRQISSEVKVLETELAEAEDVARALPAIVAMLGNLRGDLRAMTASLDALGRGG
jgi:hypothetical protein